MEKFKRNGLTGTWRTKNIKIQKSNLNLNLNIELNILLLTMILNEKKNERDCPMNEKGIQFNNQFS